MLRVRTFHESAESSALHGKIHEEDMLGIVAEQATDPTSELPRVPNRFREHQALGWTVDPEFDSITSRLDVCLDDRVNSGIASQIASSLTESQLTPERDKAMSSEWYLMSEGVVKGPVTAKQLRALAEAGKLSPMDRVRGNDGQWVEASRVKGLFEYGFEAMSPNGHAVDSRPVSYWANWPDGTSRRGLSGVTSIKQCISSRGEKETAQRDDGKSVLVATFGHSL